MKIVTWNVNSVRTRIDHLINLIKKYSPDIICLQETKVTNDSFPEKKFLEFDYFSYFCGIPSYNGVAILSKIKAQKVQSYNFCDKKDARHIQINLGQCQIHSIYVPAGGDLPDQKLNDKFKHKLTFLDEMDKWSLKLEKKNILCGDLNIAPFEDDVWSHKSLENVVSHTKIERDKLIKIIKNGKWIDCVREFINPPKNVYTWWSYRSPDFTKNNRGRRLDHIWISNGMKKDLKEVEILKEFRKLIKPSDHVPIIIDLKI
jgi:exodeoxyribonuclease-3